MTYGLSRCTASSRQPLALRSPGRSVISPKLIKTGEEAGCHGRVIAIGRISEIKRYMRHARLRLNAHMKAALLK